MEAVCYDGVYFKSNNASSNHRYYLPFDYQKMLNKRHHQRPFLLAWGPFLESSNNLSDPVSFLCAQCLR